MRTIRGKLIPETLGELVDPSTTALLLVESQCYWPLDSSAPALLDGDAADGDLRKMVAALDVLVDACEANDVLIVRSLDIAALGPRARAMAPTAHVTVATYTPSAFVYTHLISVLHSHDIATVIVAGVSTSGSVCTTAGDVLYHDFYPVVAADCVADGDAVLHRAALEVMDSRYAVVSSGDVVAAWSAAA